MVGGNFEPASQIVPERHTVFGAGLGQSEESIAAIAPGVAAGSGTHLAAGDLAADVILRTVGVQRYLRPLQHHQQFGLVGMQSLQQSIQRDEAGAAAEDAIEPCPQHQTAHFAWIGSINLEIGVEVPNQRPHLLLCGPLQIGEGVELMHQPFCMHPAQRVLADVELTGIVAQYHGVLQKPMRMDAAPLSPLGGDQHRVLDDRQTGLCG